MKLRPVKTTLTTARNNEWELGTPPMRGSFVYFVFSLIVIEDTVSHCQKMRERWGTTPMRSSLSTFLNLACNCIFCRRHGLCKTGQETASILLLNSGPDIIVLVGWE